MSNEEYAKRFLDVGKAVEDAQHGLRVTANIEHEHLLARIKRIEALLGIDDSPHPGEQ